MKKIAFAALLLAASAGPAACAGYDDLNVALSYFDQEKYDSALVWFDKAIAAGDLIPDLQRLAYLDRGMVHKSKGKLTEALADYSAAIAAQPDDMLAYHERISLYLATNDYEKTLADYEVLRKQRPRDYEFLMNVGYLNWLLGRYEPSAEVFSRYSERVMYSWLWLQVASLKMDKPMTEWKGQLRAGWPTPLIAFYMGKLPESDVLERAKDFESINGLCSADILLGIWHAVHHEDMGATTRLQSALDSCNKETFYWRIARRELDKQKSTDTGK
ncbi:MAG: tetratricopeptide repeat protein [Alphaproteobacteria bacterium]|nr:tetratricopeptide repeat protein [Alphaproteobacteria bacterium]